MKGAAEVATVSSDQEGNFLIPNLEDGNYTLVIKAPEYLECVDKVIAAATRHGKYCGNHCMTPAAYEQWHGKGMNFNLYSNEVTMIMGEAKRALTAMREQK